MTDSSLTPIADNAGISDADTAPMFYVVSKRKFTVLFLATLGLYYLYWFYKNWDRYRDKLPYDSSTAGAIWPFPRAIFAVFFVHALFREIKAYGRDKPAVAAWRNNLHATLLVVLLLAFNILDRMAARSIGSPYSDYLSVLIIVPMLFQFLHVQEQINITCDDPDGASNDRFSTANYAWLAVGALFWILYLIGLFAPV